MFVHARACVWAFGAAVAVLMAMICKNKRIAAAAAVELSCWSQCLVRACVSLSSVFVGEAVRVFRLV